MTNRQLLAAIALVLALLIAAAIWWLPQKWKACKRLYDNRPAQIICMSSGS